MKRHRPHVAPGREQARCDRCGRAGRLRVYPVTALGRLTLCRDCEQHAIRRGWVDAATTDAPAPPARSDAVSPEPRPEVMPDA